MKSEEMFQGLLNKIVELSGETKEYRYKYNSIKNNAKGYEEHIKFLEATNKALQLQRDSYAEENAQLKKQSKDE